MGAILPNTQQHIIPGAEHGRRQRTTTVVIHCIEGSAGSGLNTFIDNCGPNPSNPDAAGVAAHLIMGRTAQQTWQVADLDEECWHAVAANAFGVGIEHDGASTDSTRTWMSKADMLHRSAARTAWICHQYNLGRPRWGVNLHMHSDGGEAWGNHGDAGPGFPRRYYAAAAMMFYLRHWGRK